MKGAVLITGAGRGLGRCLAYRFAQLGCPLGLLGREASRLETTQSSLPDTCPKSRCLIADVRDPMAVAAVVKDAS